MNGSSSVPDSSHQTLESPAMNPMFGGDNGVNGIPNNNSHSPTACRSMTHSSSLHQPQQQLNNDSMNRMASSSCQSSGCRSCDSSSGHNNRVVGHQLEAAVSQCSSGGGHNNHSNGNNNSSHGLMLQLLLQNQQMLMQQQQLILFALMDQQRNNSGISHSGHQSFPGQALASTGCRQPCCSGHNNNNWPQLTNASCLSASGSSCSSNSMTAATPVLALNNGSCAGHECVTGSGVTAQQVPPPIPLPYPSHLFAHPSFPSLDPQTQGFGSPAAGVRSSTVRPEYQTPSHHHHRDQDSSPPQRMVHQSPHLLSIGSQNAGPVVVRNSAVKRRCIHASNSSLEHQQQQPLNNRMDRSSFHANNNSQWHRQSSTAGGRVLNYTIPVQTQDSFSLTSNSLTDRFRDSLTLSSSATSNPCVLHHQPMSSTPQSAAPATVHFHGGGNSGGGSQEDEAGSTSSSILTNFNNNFPTFFSSSSADPHAFPLLPPSVPRTQNNSTGQTNGAPFTAQPAMGQPYPMARGAGSSGGDRRPFFYRRQAMANGQQSRTTQDHGATGGHVESLGATGGHEAEQLLNLTTVIDKLLNENKSFMRHNNDKERNRMGLATTTSTTTGDKNSTTGGTTSTSVKANNLRQTLNLGVGNGVTATTTSGGPEASSSLLRNLLNNGNFVTNVAQAEAAFSPDSNCSSSNSTTSAGHAVTGDGATTGVRISVSTSSSMASSSVPSPSDSLREVGARLRREAEMAEQIEAALIANRDRVVVSHNQVPHVDVPVAQEPLVSSSSSQPEVSSSSGLNPAALAAPAASSESSVHPATGGACAAVVAGPSDEENEDVDTGEEREEEDEEPTTGESGYDQDVEDGVDGQADEEDEDDDDTIIRLCADAADELGQGL